MVKTQDYKPENNRRVNINHRKNISRKNKTEQKQNKNKTKKASTLSERSASLFSHICFYTQHELFPSAVIHRLERAQQGSPCRIPTYTKFFMEKVLSGRSELPTCSQDQQLDAAPLHFFIPHPINAFSTGCPSNQ